MEIFRALGALIDSPEGANERLIGLLELEGSPKEADSSELFLFQLFPYASVYLSPEGMVGGEVRDRIAGFSRALEIEPSEEPDHLATLLAFQAALAEAEEEAPDRRARAGWREARRAHLWEHLLSWLPVYLDKLGQIGPRFLRSWAELLSGALEQERETLGQARRLPLHLRDAPALPDPRSEGGAAWLAGLLSPVRCGFILTRADLVRAAGETGLGTRIGERRFVLEALLSQDPASTLAWLAAEARLRAREHCQHAESLGEISSFWSSRADSTGSLLEALATEIR